jgi:hypothetical protein
MTFKKGDPRPPGAGRKKGSGNKLTFDIKQSLMLHGPALAAELVRIAMTARNESTRVLAIKECFDRIAGKASQHVQGQVLYGISAELEKLLAQHDGDSRSIPTRTNGMLIEHDANGSDHGNNGGDNGGGLRS